MDYEKLRRAMVEEQIIRRGIKDERVLEAFRKVPRHKFVPQDLMESAYSDFPQPIGEGQTISQPYIVALMTECLDLSGEEKVLEIGSGSGYQAAILAELAKEVYSVERFANLAKRAQGTLKELLVTNVKIKIGDGTLGWPQESPFDRIIITAASLRVPLPLEEQLKEGGKLVAPLGESFAQMLTLFEKKNGKLESSPVCGCVFVPLISNKWDGGKGA